MPLADIQRAIAALPREDRARLGAWLAQLDAGAAARPDAPDETTATRLGRLAGRTLADVRKRLREP